MPFPNFLSTAAALWMLGWVSLYWAYTLLGMGRLEALLGRPRRVAFSGGLVVLTAGILVVRQSQGVQGILDWSTLVPAIMRSEETNPSDTVPAKAGSAGAPIAMTR